MVMISQHAAERYVERIDPALTIAEARARIAESLPALERASKFGARVVRQGCGAKLVLVGDTVVTVLTRRAMVA